MMKPYQSGATDYKSNASMISPRGFSTDGFLLPIESKFETLKHENKIFDQSSTQNKKYLNQHKLNMETDVAKPKIKDWL